MYMNGKKLETGLCKQKPPRRLSGTKEWAGDNVNIQLGCEHGCRYCYARYDAVTRYNRCTAEAWAAPVINQKAVDRGYGKYKDVVMFPSTHDITPRNLSECLVVLRKLLEAGNQVLIVSKPHWQCVTMICETLEEFKRQITFRFTIGSTKPGVLKFWEPNAPGLLERLGCLQYAHQSGYTTSVSCEPFLDVWPDHVYDGTVQWITDSFWLGKLRNFDQRVDLHGVTDEQIERFVMPLKKCQSDAMAREYVKCFEGKPYVKFKDSIRKIIGI